MLVNPNNQLLGASAISEAKEAAFAIGRQIEVIAAGTTIVSIGDIDHPWLRAYVGETDLGRVKLGTAVKLTTDSYPGKTYMGAVSFISSEAEFTPKQIQTKEERVKMVYRIKVEVDNSNHELKNNMPVDAEIPL